MSGDQNDTNEELPSSSTNEAETTTAEGETKDDEQQQQPSDSKETTTAPAAAGGGTGGATTSASVGTIAIDDYLPPLPLVLTMLCCSGFLFLYGFRDVFATGRTIGGTSDHALLTFTNSLDFFDDSKGWKSTQGGLSSIQQITTDANNMGGLFVRKVGGAALLGVQLTKVWPMLLHPNGALWTRGHFRPHLWTSAMTDLCLLTFYAYYLDDLKDAGAGTLPIYFMVAMVVEFIVILFYLLTASKPKRGPAVAMTSGKTPNSTVSGIVSRTTFIVTGAVTLVAGRDLFFPGLIIKHLPRDDIYLEWTGALIHSPPEGSPEAVDHGMEMMLHIGDKFVSQSMALNMLLVCLFKLVAAFGVRVGSDGSGSIKARMIWMPQTISSALVLYIFRLFASAATSASLDMRWHLMMLAYETLILGIYGWL